VNPRQAALAWAVLSQLLPATAGIAAEVSYQPEYLDAEDPLLIDIEESLDYPYKRPGRFSFDGDLRGGYFDTEVDARDGSRDDSDEYRLRFRYGANYSFSEQFRIRGRLAASCSDSDCDPSVDIARTPSQGSDIEGGELVVDEFYFGYEQGPLALVLGRQQTRSLTRGGVFATDLSRLTSPNMTVNWTDGLSLLYRSSGGWLSELITQYNDEDGSSTLARSPLDFHDDDSRLSYFYSLENREPWGVFTQRGFDITWMPSALLVDGSRAGQLEDYWALVGRLAAELPIGSGYPSIVVAGQIGYAPETPREETVATGSGGDVGGLAWHLDASWMNFFPRHSLGLNYGVTDAGWLLSSSYRPNEETLTLRYHWRPLPHTQLEIQARWREERDKLVGSLRKRDTFDWRLRLTWVLPPP